MLSRIRVRSVRRLVQHLLHVEAGGERFDIYAIHIFYDGIAIAYFHYGRNRRWKRFTSDRELPYKRGTRSLLHDICERFLISVGIRSSHALFQSFPYQLL
jgi:hypothetical protein